jgi:hypothetical protein
METTHEVILAATAIFGMFAACPAALAQQKSPPPKKDENKKSSEAPKKEAPKKESPSAEPPSKSTDTPKNIDKNFPPGWEKKYFPPNWDGTRPH